MKWSRERTGSWRRVCCASWSTPWHNAAASSRTWKLTGSGTYKTSWKSLRLFTTYVTVYYSTFAIILWRIKMSVWLTKQYGVGLNDFYAILRRALTHRKQQKLDGTHRVQTHAVLLLSVKCALTIDVIVISVKNALLTLWSWPFNSKTTKFLMSFPISSLNTLGSLVFELCYDWQTNKQTNERTVRRRWTSYQQRN